MIKMTRTAALCAVAVFAVSATASAQKIRISASHAPSGNASDNGGVCTSCGGNNAGGTFSPNVNPSGTTPNATTGATTGSNVTVSSTGNTSGTMTTAPTATVVSNLQSGSVTVTTSAGGSITVTIPPVTGGVIANAITNPSPASGQAAGQAVAQVLTATGITGTVVTAVANAIQAIGSSPNGGVTGNPSIGAAHLAIRNAINAGTLSPSQAQALLVMLVAMKAAATAH